MGEQGALRGMKVVLRPYSKGGGLAEEELRRQYRWDQDPEIRRLTGAPRRGITFIEFKHFWEGERRHPPSTRIVYAIYTLGGELIGRISCSGIDRASGRGELGIMIGEGDYWGRGYGRDAIRTFLSHLFEDVGLEMVSLFTFTSNLRAQHCFEACGFETLGSRSRITLDLEKQAGIDMAITASAFQELRAGEVGRDSTRGECDGSESG
jgi:RimJ/RimL family protein N-acetyltransferase